MDIAIMVEGQDGLTWPRWQGIVQAVERLRFAGLYRSDHFTNAGPPDKESLELWTSLTWLASHSKRIEFGPLGTPTSFRHPAFTARMAASVDDLSGGRLTLGVGAGWQEREHAHFGFDLLSMTERFARFQESLEVISRLLASDQPVAFSGRYYRIREAILLPRPQRPGGPPILVGGNGTRRTLPLAARYATEWNATFQTPENFDRLNRRLDDLLSARGQGPSSVRRSMVNGLELGRDDAAVPRRLAELVAYVLREYPVPAGSHPHDVAPAADGGVWYTAQTAGALGHLDPVTGKTGHVELGERSAPHGVIVGPDGAPWVTDGGLNAIVRVDPRGMSVQRYPLPADRGWANLNTATFDHRGILWFTGQGGVYGRLDPNTGKVEVV